MAQIHLSNPVPLVKGDFFVVRDTETTLGGGKVVDPFPRRHRPFVTSVLETFSVAAFFPLFSSLLGSSPQNSRGIASVIVYS